MRDVDRRPTEKNWSQTEIPARLADFEVMCFQARVGLILRDEPFRSLNADEGAAEIPYAAISPFTSLEVFERGRESEASSASGSFLQSNWSTGLYTGRGER